MHTTSHDHEAVSIESVRSGAITPDGGSDAEPWRVSVNGRELSARTLRAIRVHPLPDVRGLDIAVRDAEPTGYATNANAAMLAGWIAEHLAAREPTRAGSPAALYGFRIERATGDVYAFTAPPRNGRPPKGAELKIGRVGRDAGKWVNDRTRYWKTFRTQADAAQALYRAARAAHSAAAGD